MSRKSRIAVLVVLGAVPTAMSSVAFAGSPLLSGYGGPGAGEQAVIGSTLIGGAGGGAGSGGSSGSTGSGSRGSPSSGSIAASGATSARTGGSSVTGSGDGKASKGEGAGSPGGSSRKSGFSSAPGRAGETGTQSRAFVYPPGLRSASYDSPALGISGADLLLLLAAIATLALVGLATWRISRLQRGL